jgi:hypothetical protein
MPAHASTRTTQLYDRREDRVTLDEVVKIKFGDDRQRRKVYPPGGCLRCPLSRRCGIRRDAARRLPVAM